ncbi:YbfB/YjiJ family MFS transporter [Alkalimarinus sediminis]|uniref:YbfB/YjiJ family MFS transporter n=1 Tax=Alkalimarinus sediminis TaxID=1632866 RepID=A0A9E8HSX5_9ALTE|nr:YbfB/YjiJ family MFS transporter [Alkalimarinus sediminis]UZW75179.1 YbfB/YjiJ family MFS transporter [Alkalimarinus sediminis]
MTSSIERIKVLTAGVISLILMLGVARFAYTPLLPLMQQQASLGISEGGWLASINYMGYFTGVLIAASISNMMLKDRLYRLGIIVAIISTLGMALTTNFWVWSLMRYFAGLSSAAGILLGSGLILNWLIRHHYRSELGIHFAGAGLGIAFCSYIVSVMTPEFDWREQWFALSILSVLMAIPAWVWLPKPKDSHLMKSGEALVDNPPSAAYLRLFIAAYLCAGVGYVISATFIVAIVNQQNPLADEGTLVFMVLGLAAAPACIVWDLIARKMGDLNALALAFAIHTLGIVLPVFNTGSMAAYASAILFGGTFIGIVSLVLTMAGRLYPSAPSKMMGKMTISYGMAQIIAPAITGQLAEMGGSYRDGLIMAGCFMVLGTFLVLLLKIVEQRESTQHQIKPS